MENNINVLVTGGAGFIGSALSKYIISNTNFNLVILDKLTYSSDFNSFKNILNNPRVKFIKGSIGDEKLINKILDEIYLITFLI